MKSKILILGKGFIGTRLLEELQCNICEEKINSCQDADRIVKRFNPEIIINCIGNIGSNVDECEKDIDKSLIANTFVPLILAEVAIRNGIKLIHISSGCIYHYDYSKDTPIDEEKEPDFLGLFYSRTKIYSDEALAILSKKYPILIVRIRVPLDNRPHPRNILTKLINYKKAIDIPNSITYIPDFIQALKHLIKIDAKGIYNVVSRNSLRYPELLDVYKKYVPYFEYEVIDFNKLNMVRTNLELSTEKLKESGFKVRKVKDVLEECIKEYIKY